MHLLTFSPSSSCCTRLPNSLNDSQVGTSDPACVNIARRTGTTLIRSYFPSLTERYSTDQPRAYSGIKYESMSSCVRIGVGQPFTGLGGSICLYCMVARSSGPVNIFLLCRVGDETAPARRLARRKGDTKCPRCADELNGRRLGVVN